MKVWSPAQAGLFAIKPRGDKEISHLADTLRASLQELQTPRADAMMMLPVNYNSIGQNQRRLVREEYARRQGNRCYYCKALLSEPSADKRSVRTNKFPKGFFDRPVHLHHNHVTGLTIGAVHAHCNAVLWQYHHE